MYGLVKLKNGGAEDCDKRRGMAAQPNPRGAAGAVLRAGGGGRGGGGSRAGVPGGAERRVDGGQHASVDLCPYCTGTCHMAQLWLGAAVAE